MHTRLLAALTILAAASALEGRASQDQPAAPKSTEKVDIAIGSLQ